MNRIKSFRIRIAALLICTLVLQSSVPVLGAEIRVNNTGKAVSANDPGNKNSKPAITVESTSQDKTATPSSESTEEKDDTPAPTPTPSRSQKSDSTTINISKPAAAPTPTATPTPTAKPTPATVPSSSELSDKEDRAAGGGSKFSIKNIGSSIRGLLGAPAGDTTWQDSFDYTEISTESGNFIVLNKYNGDNKDVIIPETATINGIEYTPAFDDSSVSNVFSDNTNSDNTNIESVDIRNVDISRVTNMRNMFAGCTKLRSVSMSGIDTSNVTNMESFFSGCTDLTDIDMGGIDTSKVSNMSGFFTGCSSLSDSDIHDVLEVINTGNATSMASMFSSCAGLIEPDLSNLNTSKVTNMASMFAGCNGLEHLDLSGFDCSKVDSFDNFLNGCTNLKQIEIPKNIKANLTVTLPDNFINASDPAASYDSLPEGQTESYTIIRADYYRHVSGNTLTGSSISGPLTDNAITIYLGETCTLSANVTPDNATCKDVAWKVSDNSIASLVSSNMLADIKGLKKGTTRVTATTVDTDGSTGEHLTAYCDVTVIDDSRQVTSVSLNKSDITLKIKEEETLEATVNPSTVSNSNKAVEWSVTQGSDIIDLDPDNNSLDPSKAKVKAQKAGDAIVKVTTKSGGQVSECRIKVVKTPVSKITIEPNVCSVDVDDSITLSENVTITVEPEDADNTELTYESLDPDKAIITDADKGVIKGIKGGLANIKVTAKDGSGVSANCTVRVKEVPVTGVKLNKGTLTLWTDGRTGTPEQLIATVEPENATNKKVTWSRVNLSSNAVTVDQNGNVIPSEVGEAVVTVTTDEGHFTASCNVIVKKIEVSVNKVELDNKLLEIYVGQTVKLKHTISPSGATVKAVRWTSDRPECVSVADGGESGGLVTGIKPGTSTVTVTTVDGGKQASCTVIVKEHDKEVTDVILDPSSGKIYVDQEITLTATVLPSKASDKTLKWKSSNPSVASVTPTGPDTAVVRGMAVGEDVTIVAEASNGVNAVCRIDVIKLPVRVTGIYVSPVLKTLYIGEAFNIAATVMPKDADIKDIIWSSENDKIASVDGTGRVLGRSVGETKILAKTADGGFEADCKVTVIKTPNGGGGGGQGGGGQGGGGSNPYKLHIVDKRSTKAPHKDMVRGSVETLKGDRYLVITDSDGDKLKPRVNGDSSLNHHHDMYMDIRLTDVNGNDMNDFGKCTIRIPLIPEMDIKNGTVKVVAVNGDGIDKSIPSSTGTENDVSYVTFTSGHFCQYAILYTLNQSVIDYYNNYYRALANQFMTNYNGANQVRVLDHIPRTGYR